MKIEDYNKLRMEGDPSTMIMQGPKFLIEMCDPTKREGKKPC